MKHALALVLLYAGFALLAWHQVPDWPFGYDEADYMFAASLGMRANYTDTPTMPMAEFVRAGRDSAHRSDLSSAIRGANDIIFYRHWHGPLYLDWLLAMTRFTTDPHVLRGLQLMFPVLGGLVIYAGCLRLLTWPAAVLSTALYLWSEAVLRSPELAPHQLFALCCLAALFLLAWIMVTGSRRAWYGALAFTAVAFCTLEVAFVLVITLLVCGHLKRRELRADLRLAAASAGLFLGVVLIVWPGAVLKLSFLKAYAFMAYLALFRTHPWGTDMSVWQVWAYRFAQSPVEWVIIAAGIVALAFVRSEVRRKLLPFALFGVLMILAVFKVNAIDPRYMLPFIPALHVVAGSTLAELSWPGRFRMPAIAGLCMILFAARWYSLAARPLGHGEHEKAVLAWVREHQLGDKRLLVPQAELPMLHYYFPRATVVGYRDEASLRAAQAQGQFAATLYPNQP